jgi:hypothetical protein
MTPSCSNAKQGGLTDRAKGPRSHSHAKATYVRVAAHQLLLHQLSTEVEPFLSSLFDFWTRSSISTEVVRRTEASQVLH